MRVKDGQSLKDLAANLAEKTHVDRDIIMKNYMMERLLARLSVSKYRNLFIVKGGYLISSMVGIQARSTQDLDSTFVGSKISNDELVKMFEEIMNIDVGDEIRFEIIKNKTIQIDEPNEGVRITFNALYHDMKINFKIDITCGDYVSFKGVDYEFPMMFDDGTISVMSYTLETILAEKIEAILSRNINSTRMRDYYDVYIISNLYKDKIDYKKLSRIITATAKTRKITKLIKDRKYLLEQIKESQFTRDNWEAFIAIKWYAQGLSFDDVYDSVLKVISKCKL